MNNICVYRAKKTFISKKNVIGSKNSRLKVNFFHFQGKKWKRNTQSYNLEKS